MAAEKFEMGTKEPDNEITALEGKLRVYLERCLETGFLFPLLH